MDSPNIRVQDIQSARRRGQVPGLKEVIVIDKNGKIIARPISAVEYIGKLKIWFKPYIAGAAHQSWSPGIFSTVSDMFPKYAIANITGIGRVFIMVKLFKT